MIIDKRINDLENLLLSDKEYSIYTKYVKNKLKIKGKNDITNSLKSSYNFSKNIEDRIFQQFENKGIQLEESEKKLKTFIEQEFSFKRKNIFTQIQNDVIALKYQANLSSTKIKTHKKNLIDSIEKIKNGIITIKENQPSIKLHDMQKLSEKLDHAIEELGKGGNLTTSIYPLAIQLGYYAEAMIALQAHSILDKSIGKSIEVSLIAGQNLKQDILIELGEIFFGISAKAQVSLKELKKIKTTRKLKLGNIKADIENIADKQFKKNITSIYNDYKIMSYLYWIMGTKSQKYSTQRKEIIELSEHINNLFISKAILVALGITDKNPVIFLQTGNEFHRVSDLIKFLQDNFSSTQARMSFGYGQDKYILKLPQKDTIKSLYTNLQKDKGNNKGQSKSFITNYIIQKNYLLSKIYIQRM